METGTAGGIVLSQLQRNRTLLARQHLLDRADMPVHNMISHLVGMQSQVPSDPYTGLWTRLRNFDPPALSRLMLDRDAVRASLMRGTIHLVTQDDYLRLQPVMMPLHERAIRSLSSTRNVPAADVPGILAAGEDALYQTPMTSKALGIALHERIPDHPAGSLAAVCRFGLPLVQTTPRGVWGKTQQPTWALASDWLGGAIPADPAPDAVIRRYLAAFGPATVADMQAWSGLTGIRAAIDRLHPDLRVFRNERGQELFDVLDAPIIDGDVPVPVRFLPEFDNALLSHRNREHIVDEERRRAIGSVNGRFAATYLVNGFVAGTWTIEATKASATLQLSPFEPHSRAVMEELEEEGRGLLRFLSEAESHQVIFAYS